MSQNQIVTFAPSVDGSVYGVLAGGMLLMVSCFYADAVSLAEECVLYADSGVVEVVTLEQVPNGFRITERSACHA